MEKPSLRDKIRQVSSTWWGRILSALLLVVLVAFLAALIYFGYKLPWTGFAEYSGSVSSRFDRPKSLWDWLDLLLVPLLLALGAWLLNRSARTREQEAEERRVEEQQKIEEDRSRDDALQKYLDTITDLLNDGLRESEQDDVKRIIARARTLTVLRQLDEERKGLLLQFLSESGLIGKEGQ